VRLRASVPRLGGALQLPLTIKPASRVVMLSHPGAVADVIAEAAHSIR